MEKTAIGDKLVKERFNAEIKKMGCCKYCGYSGYLGGVTIPSSDGRNRVLFCLNHKPGGIILERFAFDPN